MFDQFKKSDKGSQSGNMITLIRPFLLPGSFLLAPGLRLLMRKLFLDLRQLGLSFLSMHLKVGQKGFLSK